MPGPPRKPSAIQRLQGNPRHRTIPRDEPQIPVVPDTFDEPPPAIADDPIAASEWRRLAPLLRIAKVVTDADRNALLSACQQWSIYQDALAQAPANRRVIKTPNGFAVPNPFLSIANKALTHCERLWQTLGLTPSARSTIRTATTTKGDEFDEFDTDLAPVRRVRSGPTLNGRTYADPTQPH